MKRPFLAIAALALMANPITSAHAAKFKSMPIELVGEWCSVEQTEEGNMQYQLPSWADKCDREHILSIDQYGFSYDDNTCYPTSMRLKKDHAPSGTAHTATLKAICNQSSASKGFELDFKFERYKGNLTITVSD